ncbi:COG1470 family protein [Chryseobacterium terrae]|uniref:Ubp3 associated protein Bre5 n=1 Tax=Chryseobacterium terrae TaxID=3163299 RepID=A0ABW8Y6A8_9FLAO
MIKKWIIYFTLLFPVFIFSQKKDSLKPGTSTSISFTIENKSAVIKNYILKTEASSNLIIPILKSGEISVSPNESKIYIVPLQIATEASKGKYSVFLEGTEVATGEKINQTTELLISGNRKISLSLLDSPEFVKAGEIIQSTFLLKNYGNVSENLILESKNATVDSGASIILSPGESKKITVSKKTPSDLGKNEYQNLNLSVFSRDNPQENQTSYSSIKVISIKPVEEDIYHRFPVSAYVFMIGMQNRDRYENGFQGELYGKGSLDNENKHLLEFHAVTKNPVDFNSFTQYEEYFVNYKNENLSVHLGDKNYLSSFLTEYARYGRGAEIRFDLKKISFGGFYNHPRFFRDIKDEFNIYSKLKIGRESEATAGYLYKIPRKEGSNIIFSNTILDSNAHLPYLTGKFSINKNLEISGETSYSQTEKTNGTAFMIQTIANFERIKGNVMYMRSSPEYAGYFNNTSNVNINLQYQLSKKIHFIANYVQDAKNFQRDTLFLSAPYRKYLQYGIQYKYSKNGNIIFYGGTQRYEDRLMPKEFDYNDRFFKLSVNQQIGIFQLNIEGQLGKTDNYLTGISGNSSFYTANIGFEKFKTSFNIFGSYALTSRYQLENQKQFYFGARILNRLSDKTQLSLFYQNNYMPEDYYTDRNLFELLFQQQIFSNHEFGVSARYNLQRGELGNKDFIFSLRYTLKINVPTQKIAEYTTLSGNIKNLGVKKVDGIRLMLGNHLSITDKYGNYLFKNINPGDYVLEIDRSTTDINDITDQNVPVSLILTDQENIFNFGLTSAAKIQGKIDYTEQGSTLSFVNLSTKKNKKENVILEVTNGNQTFRKMAVLGDYFDFTYLRPGDWKVKVYRNGLDKKYKIPIDHFEFNLKPAETKNITINIIKQSSEIKYQKEAIKVSYNENKKRK